MKRACEDCKTSFEAKRPTARFCSATCQKRAKRRAERTIAPTTKPVAVLPGAEREDQVEDESIAGATIKALRDAGRLDTPRGRLALKAARIIDASTAIMGMAALMKDFDRALEAALAGAVVEHDEVDEVERKRQEKLRRLGIG